MSTLESTVATLDGAETSVVSFEAADVTGTHRVIAKQVQRDLPAGAVAKSLAVRMSMPQNVPWALRDDSTSAYLDESRPIGDQIKPGAKVTLTPKTHLG